MNLGEMIIVMLVSVILLTSVFVGGNAMIDSANLTVAQNDLRSFEIAAQQTLMEHLDLQTITDTTKATGIFNQYLSEEMKITGGKSAKKDPWKNTYNVSFSTAARSGGNEFYIMVVSSGKNGSLTTTKLEKDDCGIIIRLKDSEITSEMFGFKNSEFSRIDKNLNEIVLGVE